MDYRRIARITGWLWIVTFITSITARFIFYAPVLEKGKDYVLGQGNDAMTLIAFGALLESSHYREHRDRRGALLDP